MRYLCLICYDEKKHAALSRDEAEALAAEARDYVEELRRVVTTSLPMRCNPCAQRRRCGPVTAASPPPTGRLPRRRSNSADSFSSRPVT